VRNDRLEFELFKVNTIADEGADLMLKVEAAEATLNAVVVEAGRKDEEAKAKVEQAGSSCCDGEAVGGA
jgi:signal transduction histidine kinase